VLVIGGFPEDREHVASAFHRESAQSRGPFVRVRCDREEAVLQRALESWLSAADDDPGANPLRRAEHGTLFLDSIEALSPWTQRALLPLVCERPLDPHDVPPPPFVGRLIVGASEDLSDAVSAARFLPALYDAVDKIRIDLEPACCGGAA